MAFHPCKREDPFTAAVRRTYRANVVRAPRSGLDPYVVLAVRDGTAQDRGTLSHLLVADATVDLPAPTPSSIADLTGTWSADLGLKAGVDLTGQLLAAVGLPIPGLGFHATLWEGARTLAFEVRGVEETALDLGAVGSSLRGARLDRHNPAASIFFDEASVEMHLVTRVLKSATFAIRATDKHGESLKVEVSGFDDLLGQVSGEGALTIESETIVTASGPNPVTFAFSTVPCLVKVGGRLDFGLALGGLNYLDAAGAEQEFLVEHLPVVDHDGLLDVDVWSAP